MNVREHTPAIPLPVAQQLQLFSPTPALQSNSKMDFFFKLFFPAAPAEARAELESEIEQIPVDFDDGGGTNNGGCIVA